MVAFGRRAATVLVGAVVFLVDLCAFWFIWAEADAIPSAHLAIWREIAWPLISFPVFSVTSKSIATVYFWEFGFLNAFLWACGAAFLAWKKNFR
jgi:hypothetical protein